MARTATAADAFSTAFSLMSDDEIRSVMPRAGIRTAVEDAGAKLVSQQASHPDIRFIEPDIQSLASEMPVDLTRQRAVRMGVADEGIVPHGSPVAARPVRP